jgi:hypothetical protein
MRILLVADPNRGDMYGYLEKDTENEYILLWFEDRYNNESKPLAEYSITFKKEWYWKDFLTPQSLLDKIQPDKIVFIEIIDLRQIALIVAARSNGISTFYLEHGAAGDAATAIVRWEDAGAKERKLNYLIKRLGSLWTVLEAKFFYYSVFSGFKSFSSLWIYWALPFKMLKDLPNKVLSHNIFPERVPRHCIVFNRINLEEFALYTGIDESQALLTGVPFFDKYYAQEVSESDYIVYIDHPYYEDRIANWTEDHHKSVANKLLAFAESRRQKLYIKLHPRSDRGVWEKYNYNPEWVEILQYEDCTKLYLESKIILGFSSSLTTAFLCARKNFVLLGWNPEPQIFGMDFSEGGLCHSSLCPDDLESKFDFWCANNLAFQEEKYRTFLHRCNEPFDGKATERVLNAIHTL